MDVVAAPVLSYTDEVLSGARRYLLPTPVVPGAGAIGRVRAVGPDATRLQPGDWVFCDPRVRSRDGAATPDITLQGASARREGGQKLQRYFRDRTFAEQVRVPTENAAPIGIIPAEAAAAITEAARYENLDLDELAASVRNPVVGVVKGLSRAAGRPNISPCPRPSC